MKQLYNGAFKDFHWVGFGSGSGTNLRECAGVIRPKLIVCDKPKAGLLELDELAGIDQEVLNGYRFCGSGKKAREALAAGDEGPMAEYRRRSLLYNEAILDKLQRHEREHGRIDLLVLGGWMRLVQAPILDAYEDRIINVHPADLSILTGDNERKYVGPDAVYDALNDDVGHTRSSVIFVDEGVDRGEIITMGQRVSVAETVRQEDLACQSGDDPLRVLTDAHQGRQKTLSDWPALTTALQMIAQGRVALSEAKEFHDKWRRVLVDGVPMPYQGFEVGR